MSQKTKTDKPKISKYIDKIIYNEEQINEAIKKIALWIDQTYKDSNDLVIVGLLKGCVPFLAQLIKYINVDCQIDFMIASSYHGKSFSSGNVKIVMDLSLDIAGKDILVVEDVIESGITIQKTLDILGARNPKSLRVVSLLDKTAVANANIKIDQVGFKVKENLFLIGFGLDYQEKLRNLPYIGTMNKKYINDK
ncbi:HYPOXANTHINE-GUANINE PHOSPHORIBOSYLTRANSFERASE (HGPRT) (HGPRTASE) [Mycoplasmopsis pulmonis]|uniref:Hypoxanthine phosphoribosyltransferase n=1 Tax=Mycoplasmopsis pulmonis (strain UAB CTIP) TaxID=272635 RepID=Q98Q18_MYCPU|nr:hypoxanthine phosphoribosyltransferase [Mycoplasmopsis pulmonis]CAC13724.1 HYPOXANTHINE-GUANINE PHOSPHORIBOSYLTRANSFERASE (HGPRT) (HGPRTASE) [Mycoplasmopsis pulmonis]VEU68316.1 hypoxanthine-guanine phosphoribosyltransferases [Mycoplasmopsis pulmonis]